MKTTTKSILRFICRSVAVVAPVVVLFVVWYAVSDPFKVLRHYDSYFPDPKQQPVRIGVNKGLATFTNLNDRRHEGHDYNAFIFGSSISCYYNADKWATIVSQAEGVERREVRPYHMDSSSETLESMARKAVYLDRNGFNIRYALIVLDPVIMNTETDDGPAYLDPPQLQHNLWERMKWHYTFFRAATNADFFKSWWPARFTGIALDKGHNRIFNHQPIEYDPVTNQESLPQWDSIISANPGQFYAEHPLRPSAAHSTVSPPVLNAKRRAALEEIAGIFRQQRTSYQIIIGPNRAKITLNPEDLKVLQQTFGREHVNDYSITQAAWLESDTLLYDNTHYRPVVAREFMEKAYLGK